MAAASTPPPNFSSPSRARARICSTFQPALATPMTGTLRWPRLIMACNDGKIFLWARSPVAPKKTSASEWGTFIMSSSLGGFFQMSAKLVTHRGEQLVGKICLAPRAKTLIQRSCQDVSRHTLVDGGLDRPAPLARVRNLPCEFREGGISDQRNRRQVQQPRGNHAAAPPHLRNVRQIEVVLVVLGVAQWRRLGVDLMFLLADIGGAQHAQPFCVGGHDAVLDAVVNHLYEVAGAVRSAMQVTLLGGTADLFTPRRARYFVAHAGSQPGEDGIEMLDYLRLPPNHHAVASLQAPDPTTRPHVHVMNSLRRQFLGAPDIVHVVGVAAVDKDVA